MFKRILLPAISLALVIAAAVSCGDNDIEKLRKRFQSEAMSRPANAEHVRNLMETILPDGTWPGIDYVDTSRIAFQHTDHLNNLVNMALAYRRSDSELKNNKELKEKFDLALNHWLEKDYICENWWNNQIGTPTTMVQLLYVMDSKLDTAQVSKMLKIAGRANMNASGARPSGDRAKIASILAQTQLWARNEEQVKDVLEIIEGEVRFSGDASSSTDADVKANPNYFVGGRGLQRDYSFHHRADRVNNTTSYGSSYLGAIIDWAVKVNDTEFKFSEKTTGTIVDYFLDGICKQMVYGTMVDPGVRNRDIARPGSHSSEAVATRGTLTGSTSMAESILKICGGYRQSELEEIIAARNGDHSGTPSFAKFFWQTEHFVFQRPGYYTSVRMFSTRNKSMEEPYNGEGLTNHYRADGTNYLSVYGDEYSDIYPCFDFRKIPGATVMQDASMPSENDIQKSGEMDFVGGVTDGLYGAVAFDFISPIDPVRARKSWFFFDDAYVCLGSGIASQGSNPVFTTLNQCYLRGDVTVGTPSGVSVAGSGDHRFSQVNWMLHDGVGYAFMDSPAEIGLTNRTVSGNWQRLNRQTTVSRETIEKDIFALWINHGPQVKDGHYAYAVLPGADKDKMNAFTAKPSVDILSNTPELQAVFNSSLGIGYAAFYSEGTVDMDKISLACSSPLLVMIHVSDGVADKISLADPSRTLKTASFSVSGSFKTENPKAKATFDSAANRTAVVVELPDGDYAGESITL